MIDWHLRSGTGYVSAPARALLGWDAGPEAIAHDAWRSAIHPDDRPSVLAAQQLHLEGDETGYDVEYRLATAPDTRVREHGRVLSWHDDGRPARMITLIRPTTEELACR